MPPTLYLIDGHALAYRMYFALTAGSNAQRWQTSKGEPTSGTYGFARELMRIMEQEKPEYLAVAFDTGRTFRHRSATSSTAHLTCRLRPAVCRAVLNSEIQPAPQSRKTTAEPPPHGGVQATRLITKITEQAAKRKNPRAALPRDGAED